MEGKGGVGEREWKREQEREKEREGNARRGVGRDKTETCRGDEQMMFPPFPIVASECGTLPF